MKFNFNDVEDPYANKNKSNKVIQDVNKEQDNKINIPSLDKQEE